MKRSFLLSGAAVAALAAGLIVGQVPSAEANREDRGNRRPAFVVDEKWPKPLPNSWLVGQVAGVAVDRYDRIWIVQRQSTLTVDERGSDPPASSPRRSDCCNRAPAVMVFDREGNLLKAWGGAADPGFLTSRCTPAIGCEWPTNEHGIYVDHMDYVYIAGNGGGNHQVLKFTNDGSFVYQIGKAGVTGGSNDTNGGPGGRPLLGQPADMEVDPTNNELYIADGYQNKRVLVVDAATGVYKRHWGAYGNVPDDANPGPYDPAAPVATQFRNPVHCVRIAKDGLVYVCDRVNNRYQIFRKDGTFVREAFLERDTLGNGSMWDIDLSPDAFQRELYNADGENNRIAVFDRATDRLKSQFGRNGRSAGQFHWVHNLAVDSEGNIYTAEVDTGKRAQKFRPAGR